MARVKRRSGRSPGAAHHLQAQRNLEKGHLRQALKDARAAYRQQRTDDHRRVLEIALLARAMEFRQRDERELCRPIVDELLALRPYDELVVAGLPELLIWLGMPASNEAALAGPSPPKELPVPAIDEAVLGSELALAVLPSPLKDGVLAVRAALAFVSRSSDAEAVLALRAIPRQSPLADWKFFVRGLLAHYGNAVDDRTENWSRLEPLRPAHRLARALAERASANLSVGRGNRKPRGPGQVLETIVEVVALGDDVLDVKRLFVGMLRQVAILTTVFGPSLNLLPCSSIHVLVGAIG